MDYSLAALKLMCAQLKDAQLKDAKETASRQSFILGGILFQRAWLQGILVSASDEDGGHFILDDGTGVIELFLSGDFRKRHWRLGMYVMVAGGYFVRPDQLPMIKVHKIVDLSAYPDREAMWYLEVMEAHRVFYQPLVEDFD
ncbi:hypothetical protein Ancab_007644 [Ancistrocladus abbreviatus]